MPNFNYINMLNNHDKALKAVKKTYEGTIAGMNNAVYTKTGNAEERVKEIGDVIFLLDYMIASNQRVLKFLKQFERHKTTSAAKAFDDILLKIDEHANIGQYDDIDTIVTKLEAAIKAHAPAITKQLKNDYQFKSRMNRVLAFFSAASLIATMAYMKPLVLALGPWARSFSQ